MAVYNHQTGEVDTSQGLPNLNNMLNFFGFGEGGSGFFGSPGVL